MIKRKFFEGLPDGASIELWRNGSLEIEIESEYGDSEFGWGSVTGYLSLKPADVERLRKFLTPDK